MDVSAAIDGDEGAAFELLLREHDQRRTEPNMNVSTSVAREQKVTHARGRKEKGVITPIDIDFFGEASSYSFHRKIKRPIKREPQKRHEHFDGSIET